MCSRTSGSKPTSAPARTNLAAVPIWGMGARPAIPPKRNEAPVACPAWIYANRRLVENLWTRLKGSGQCHTAITQFRP